MSNTKKLISAFTVILVLVFLATAIYKKSNSGEWITLKESSITEAIYGLATLESDDLFRYRVGVISQIKKNLIKEGESVKKGDALLQLAEGAIIRSPIDGVVTQLDTKIGEIVFPNVNLVTVMNLDRVALTITLEQASAMRVRPQLPVQVQFENVKGEPIQAVVRSVYPKDGQFVVKVDLKETPRNILPGMTADTAIVVAKKERALLVPIRAIQRGILTIKHQGQTKKIKIKIGFQDLENAELITSEEYEIKPGMEVWVPKK
jgi:macrolide-specific efflux system membrane fusion protein